MTARFIVGDVLEVLSTLEAGSVDLILTSPPFLALRSYLPADHPDKAKEGGSQPTPGAFIDWLVDVVEALDRVLAPHGSMVIELGDTYAGTGGAGGDWSDSPMTTKARVLGGSNGGPPRREISNGWPADKSLTLIPELFRMTLVYGFNPLTGRQTRRWRLRNVIRWVRPNPPVGALGDKFRPATSELMVFCRTDEAGRRRYFDLDAVREPVQHPLKSATTAFDEQGDRRRKLNPYDSTQSAGAPPLDWWNIPLLPNETDLALSKSAPNLPVAVDHEHSWNIPLLDGEEPRQMGPKPEAPKRDGTPNNVKYGGVTYRDESIRFAERIDHHPLGAPPLDWWEIPPGGYQGAHYAVFPEALCVRPIKAMSPERVCRTCGEPSRRIVDVDGLRGHDFLGGKRDNDRALGLHGTRTVMPDITRTTVGWSECSHDNWRPGLVLDPFTGSGTTLAVAVGHGRDALGIDLDERNLELARGRLGMFLEAAS